MLTAPHRLESLHGPREETWGGEGSWSRERTGGGVRYSACVPGTVEAMSPGCGPVEGLYKADSPEQGHSHWPSGPRFETTAL